MDLVIIYQEKNNLNQVICSLKNDIYMAKIKYDSVFLSNINLSGRISHPKAVNKQASTLTLKCFFESILFMLIPEICRLCLEIYFNNFLATDVLIRNAMDDSLPEMNSKLLINIHSEMSKLLFPVIASKPDNS